VVFANVRSCFSWDSSHDLKYECVTSTCVINLYVWVKVYVDFPYVVFVVICWPMGV
jgi:hypothetical protein